MRNDHLTSENNKLSEDMKVMTSNMLHGDAIGREQLNTKEKHWSGQAASLKGDLEVKHKEAGDLRKALKDQKAAHDDVCTLHSLRVTNHRSRERLTEIRFVCG